MCLRSDANNGDRWQVCEWMGFWMAWVRVGDNAATYPKLMRVAALKGCDMRTKNEVFGFLVASSSLAAAHTTDYLVDVATATLVGMERTDDLIRICKTVGLIVDEHVVDGVRHVEIIDDPEFIHMRTAAEIKTDRQRKTDNSNPRLTAAVRLRDGDQCRWCGVVTWWGTADRKSGRVGTYDHLDPVTKTDAAATVDSLVVACRTCNSARKDGDGWDRELLQPPAPPHYSPATAAFIAKHLGITVVIADDKRSGSQPENAHPRGPAPSGVSQPARRDDTGGRDDTVSDPAAGRGTRTGTKRRGRASSTDPPPIRRDPPDRQGPGSGFTGSGRVGSDRSGSGRSGSAQAGRGRSGSRAGRRRRGSRRSP